MPLSGNQVRYGSGAPYEQGVEAFAQAAAAQEQPLRCVSVEADADSPLLRTFVFAQRSPEEEALRPGDRAAPSAVEVL